MTYCKDCNRPCPEHGVLHCPTCHKHEGECDIGSCEEQATYRLVSSRENRPVCEHHATSEYWGMIRKGYRVETL